MLSTRLFRALSPQSLTRKCIRPFAADSHVRDPATDLNTGDSEAEMAEERLNEERVGQEGNAPML